MGPKVRGRMAYGVLHGLVAGLVLGGRKGPQMPEPTGVIPASIQGGTRDLSRIRLIVLHSTESDGGARNIANYFASGSAGGSTQLVVGEDGIFRCVEDDRICAGAPGANEDGLHIEIVGRAAWTREQWLERPTTLNNAAVCVAAWCGMYGIPIGMTDVLDPQALLDPDRKMITTHRAVSLAFRKSDHMDPGLGFPYDQMAEGLLWLCP